jgi:succinate-acetate transporter protein
MTIMGTTVGAPPSTSVQTAAPGTATGAASPAMIADPVPLGFAGFGLTAMLLAPIFAGWIGTVDEPVVLGLALPFGGLAQILAGMWAFRRGNTFIATAFTSYGAFFISFALIVQFYVPQVIAATVKDLGPGATPPQILAAATDHLNVILGLYLFMWGVFTTYMFVASLASARAIQSAFFVGILTFFALAIGKWAGSETWEHIGGVLGLILAVNALYVSFADVVNANFRRVVLPLGRPRA